jgi:hypothetical protein
MRSCEKLHKEFQNLRSQFIEAIVPLEVMEGEELRVGLDSLREQARSVEPHHLA